MLKITLDCHIVQSKKNYSAILQEIRSFFYYICVSVFLCHRLSSHAVYFLKAQKNLIKYVMIIEKLLKSNIKGRHVYIWKAKQK